MTLVIMACNYGTPSVQFYKDYKYLSSNDLPSMVSYGNSDKSIRQIQYKYSTDYADQMSAKDEEPQSC